MAAIRNCLKHGLSYGSYCPQCGPGMEAEEWDFRGLAPVRQEGMIIGPDDPQHWTGQRPVLKAFADQMELKLRKNDDKTGWRKLPVEALFRLLMIEIEEFKVGHEFFGKEEARKELIDVANYCMILYDRLGMEEDKNVGATK